MRLFDSHCHFESTDESAITAVLERARACGVERILAVGGSAALDRGAVLAMQIADAHPDAMPAIVLALGRDRDQCELPQAQLSTITGPRCAVGEIGLDYHYSPETRDSQLRLFREQLQIASQAGLPVVIHTREAADDTAALLREIPSRGVIHCFTGTPEEAKTYLDLGFFISISGIVTFRLADNVRESARMIPADRLLMETDSPFLAPVPMRGNPNEPAFLVHTCEFLARVRGTTAEDLSELCFKNALSMLEQ